jgi:hypothetical protein
MSEWLLFPVLEIVLPIMETLQIPTWLICIGAFISGAAVPVGVISAVRWFKGIHLHWSELGFMMVPIFIWGLSILASKHQLALTGWSFYAGLFAFMIPGLELYQHYLHREERSLMRWLMCVGMCLIPIIAAYTASSPELGPELTWNEYFSDPGKLVRRF